MFLGEMCEKAPADLTQRSSRLGHPLVGAGVPGHDDEGQGVPVRHVRGDRGIPSELLPLRGQQLKPGDFATCDPRGLFCLKGLVHELHVGVGLK